MLLRAGVPASRQRGGLLSPFPYGGLSIDYLYRPRIPVWQSFIVRSPLKLRYFRKCIVVMGAVNPAPVYLFLKGPSGRLAVAGCRRCRCGLRIDCRERMDPHLRQSLGRRPTPLRKALQQLIGALLVMLVARLFEQRRQLVLGDDCPASLKIPSRSSSFRSRVYA